MIQPFDFFILTTLLAGGFFGIFYFSYDRGLQSLIILFMGIAYVLWGVWHHKKEGLLVFRIILEYALFAGIGIIMLLSLISKS